MSSCQLFERGGEISAFREMNVRYFIQIIDDAPLSENSVSIAGLRICFRR
jgi:hypothetical protein